MRRLISFLFALAASVAIHAAIIDGTCGDNLTWTLNTQDSTLIISGTGAMTSHPWYEYRAYIMTASLPDGLTSIGESAFGFCSHLTSVTIPNSVTSIGKQAFQYCSGLTSITIPNSVTSIGDQAFYNCISLTSVTIPNSVTSIANYAFAYCTSLTSVTIPNSVTSIGENAFQYCSSLTSITIPNSVTSIGKEAFGGCSSLTSIVIPNSVTSIGYWAFYGCSGLTSVTIPSSVTSIGGSAFSGCSGLTSVYNYATTPQAINSFVFYEVNINACSLYVPEESIELYRAADGWKEFGNIVGIDTSDSQVVVVNPANKAQKLIRNGNVYILTDTKTYSVSGVRVE